MRNCIIALSFIVSLSIVSVAHAQGPRHRHQGFQRHAHKHHFKKNYHRTNCLQYRQSCLKRHWEFRRSHRFDCYRCGYNVDIRIYDGGQRYRIRECYRGQTRIYHGRLYHRRPTCRR